MSILDVQEAVTIEINATFDYNATNEFTPKFVLDEMETLKVVVAPAEVKDSKRFSRESWEEKPVIHVGVGRRVQAQAEPPASAKEILEISIGIRKHFKNNIRGLVGQEGQYAIMAVDFIPFYDADVLSEQEMVLSIISIVFQEFTE